MSKTRIVIVGGVAGGMSCAARARRLSEEAEIIVLERGPYPSFANCGLPYHIGGEIADRNKLIVQSAENLKRMHNLDVRPSNEVLHIDRDKKTIAIRDHEHGRDYEEPYDYLVLSMGAAPIRPPIPGIDREGIFTLRNIPDTDRINHWIEEKDVQRAVVGGGGYIGLEIAEQLRERGINVALAEGLPQVMAPLDPEMASMLHAEMRQHGIDLYLNNLVERFEEPEENANSCTVALKGGERLPADLVVLGLGVRPESKLAKEAELELSGNGAIRVDDQLRTSDPAIYAVGDAIEVRNPVSDQRGVIPLAGPANRQGRAVADNIFGRTRSYGGTIGTAVLRLFSLTAACTGVNEKALRQAEIPYHALHLHPPHHVGYYPGAKPIALKLLFHPETRKVLGAQAVGEEGVDKRIDVVATAIKAGMTVDDMAELELCYAPPFGGAKDPINLAAMAAQNILDGLSSEAHWSDLDDTEAVIVDVRNPPEREKNEIPGSVFIPLPELRTRLEELPKDKPIIVHCASGQRSYYATRILRQNGFQDVRNLSGSMRTWKFATENLAVK